LARTLIAGCGIALAVLFVILGVARILPWEAAGTLAATTIGVVSMIIALERQETRRKDAVPTEQSRLESEEGLFWEESILVSKNSCSHYDFTIDPNERITGEISSDSYFNVYFVTPRNFTKYNDGDDDFKYEYGTEHASRLKVNFAPGKAGRFYCIIESATQASIDVNVSLHVIKI
jgi:hypothetical protein